MMETDQVQDLAGFDQGHMEVWGLFGDPDQRWTVVRRHRVWQPPTDVYETKDSIVVKVEIAGMEQDGFTVALESRKLTISGVRHDSVAKLGYQQMEIQYGQFETQVLIARSIDESQIEAVYENGFLSVRLPKAKPRRVQIVSGEEGLG